MLFLWPLGRKIGEYAGGGCCDLLVYQDRLEEIGRDRSAGLIGSAEADASAWRYRAGSLAAAGFARRPEAAGQG